MLYTSSIKYPNTFDTVSGKTNLDEKLTSINKCIALILTTAKGELLGDPNFGCTLYELLYEQYSENLQQIIKSEIVESLSSYESRITLTSDDITIEENNTFGRNSFTITINYTLKNSTVQSTTTVVLEEGMLYGSERD